MKLFVDALIIVLFCCHTHNVDIFGSHLSCTVNSTCYTMGYSRNQLISLKNNFSNDSSDYISILKKNGIFKFEGPRGCCAGKQVKEKFYKIQTVTNNSVSVTSSRSRSDVHSKKSSLHSENSSGTSHGINQSNLIQIPCKAFKDNGWKLSQICHLNAQSVKNKTHSIKDYIIEKDIQLLAITETWLKANNEVEMGEITPDGYKLDPLHRKHNKQGGGVAIIHHLGLKAKVSDKGHFTSYDYIEIHIPLGSDSVRLVVIYRPPYNPKTNPVTDSTFLVEFSTHLEKVVPCADYLVVTGDFNVHVNLLDVPDGILSDSAKKYKAVAEKFMDKLDGMGLCQHIVGPTHRSGNTLDLVITRTSDHVLHGKPYVDAMLSDHCALLFRIQVKKPPVVLKKVSFRIKKNIDLEAFRHDISHSRLLQDPHLELSELVHCYNDCLSTILDSHAPAITKDIPVRPRQPWYNDNICVEKQTRRRLERKWKKDKSQVNEECLRVQKNRVNSLINNTRSVFYSKKIEECGNDQKKTFCVIKDLFHKNGDIPYPEHTSMSKLTEDFSEFFIQKIELIREKLDAAHVSPPVDPKCQYIFEAFQPLTQDQVRKFIVKSPCKSCSLDPIPTDLLRECLDLLVPVITDIINMSLSTGSFPDDYKLALVTPLLKKLGLELIFPSYRPVSNLQFLSKLTERAAASQFVEELLQSAYSQYHSTETALTKVHNDIMLAMDNQKVVLLLLLDLSAAFDTVDHAILLARLHNRFGVSGTALQWFQSYLTGRSQAVSVQGNRSSSKVLQCGVPQGSVLGPILFCCYTAPPRGPTQTSWSRLPLLFG